MFSSGSVFWERFGHSAVWFSGGKTQGLFGKLEVWFSKYSLRCSGDRFRAITAELSSGCSKFGTLNFEQFEVPKCCVLSYLFRYLEAFLLIVCSFQQDSMQLLRGRSLMTSLVFLGILTPPPPLVIPCHDLKPPSL